MSDPVRIVVPIDRSTNTEWETSLNYALGIGQSKAPGVCDYVLLRHTKKGLDQTTLAQQLEPQLLKDLVANKRVDLPGDGTLRHEAPAALERSFRNAVVIVYYADAKILEKLDAYRDIFGVIAVKFEEDDISQWIDRWNPLIHGESPDRLLI
jgi:plasmid stabilization system protein ParE